ncbi:hypothetical protein CCZ01_05015 [Helicobacter monodelphidis]|uniref:DNA polymerase III subunit delta' n=1 Tax=Helicobacter sp. 15-1451 TaxID=2004995 RepID=UPI000DCDD0A7|nr:DNA polymerase III subunit delta' [Helicobacter sp. 15-1451]RAX57810.1 hypothetical protein CCZ01_05015 [Helicobacter sp. 15-1451]
MQEFALDEEQGSFILLVDSPQECFESLQVKFKSSDSMFFLFCFRDIFEIDDAKEVVRLAYIHHYSATRMVLAAKSYNEYAQNSLLKILEEPPSSVYFTLITSSKSAILPTIRSRLRIVNMRQNVSLPSLNIDLQNISLDSIYTFLKAFGKEFISKEEVKERVSALLICAKQVNIPLNEEDLQAFHQAFLLAEQFERAEHIFLPLLLRILRHKQNARIKYA